MKRTKVQILAELSDAIRENLDKETSTVSTSLLIDTFNIIIQGAQEIYIPDMNPLDDSEEINEF